MILKIVRSVISPWLAGGGPEKKDAAMLGTHNRPFSCDVHSINLSMLNQPGTLARVLVALQHHDVNVENVRIDPTEAADRSRGVLTITAPKERLGLLQSKLMKLIGVLDAEVIASPMISERDTDDGSVVGEEDDPTHLRLMFD